MNSCCGFHLSGQCESGGGMAIGDAVTSATEGSVMFAGAAGVLAQDNTNLFWDDSNNRLGIGTATPAVALSVFPDTDAGAIIGRARIDARSADTANFSHFDHTGTSSYALQALSNGNVVVNCVNGAALTLRHNGGVRMTINSTGLAFFAAAAVAAQVSAANLTNNVTAGGVNDTIADYTDLVVYANDAEAIRNDIHQLARKLKQINDGLRTFGLFT